MLEGNPYCSLINRFPYDGSGVLGAPGGGAGADRSYDAKYINKGGTKTSGIDVAFNWTVPMIGIPGSLALNAAANILLEYQDQAFPGAAWVSYRGTAQNQAFNYSSRVARAIWVPRAASACASVSAAPQSGHYRGGGTTGADPHAQFDLFTRYQLTNTLEVRAGVDNLFNARPEIFGATPTNSAGLSTLPVYDTIGRSFYFGVKMRM